MKRYQQENKVLFAIVKSPQEYSDITRCLSYFSIKTLQGNQSNMSN